MWQDSDKITGQSIGRALVTLAVPAVMSTFFTVIFEVVDMFWIGSLGGDAIAALSASSYYIWMLRGLALAVATGSIALVSRRTGEKDEKGLIVSITDAVISTVIYALMVVVIFLPLAFYIYRWLNFDPVIAGLAEEYTVVFIAGLIFVYMMMTLEYIIRGIGDTRNPMIIAGISFLLNLVLDPLFIFNLDMGIKGAAYATILSQAVGAILMAIELFRKLPGLKPNRHSSFLHELTGVGQKLYRIVKIGGPVALSDAAFCVIYLLLTGIIDIYGKGPLAALGIAHRLEGLPFFICLGFSMAVSPMVGQFLGAGKPEHAKKTVFLSLKITGALLLGIAVVYFALAPLLCRFFTGDPEIIQHGVLYLRMLVFFDVFLIFEVVLGGAFAGAGDTKSPFLIIFPITALRIPLAYLFAVVFHWPIASIWVVIIATMVAKGTLLLLLFNKGKWASRRI